VLLRGDVQVNMAEDFWPVSFTPAAGSVASGGPNRYNLPVPATPAPLVGLPNLRANYWVSNFGLVGSVAAGSGTPLLWTAPSDSDPRKLDYRVQFRSNDIPVHPTSQHQGLLGPRPWTTQDIGSVGTPGSTKNFSQADFALEAAGADIWGTADAFRFAHTPLSGDGEVIAQVVSLENTNPWAKAGVMIRESLNPNATNAFMAFTPGNGFSFQRRTTTGGSSASTSGGAATSPAWVKVVRSGNIFTGHRSTNGIHWTQVGSVTITMGASVFAGVAVTSHNSGVLATANIDRINVGPTPVALLVTNSLTLGAGDTAVRSRLQSLGYSVIVKTAPSTVTGDATGKALVVVSSTVTSGDVNTKFRAVTVPVLTWESGIFDDMGMTGGTANDLGTQPTQSQVSIVSATHPLAAGLSGVVSAVSPSSTFTWGSPNANAARVATIDGNPNRYTVFGYDAGAAMPGLAAPARRVGFFLGDHTAAALTPSGWQLFDSAARWATIR
jgi:hypothetical protein